MYASVYAYIYVYIYIYIMQVHTYVALSLSLAVSLSVTVAGVSSLCKYRIWGSCRIANGKTNRINDKGYTVVSIILRSVRSLNPPNLMSLLVSSTCFGDASFGWVDAVFMGTVRHQQLIFMVHQRVGIPNCTYMILKLICSNNTSRLTKASVIISWHPPAVFWVPCGLG